MQQTLLARGVVFQENPPFFLTNYNIIFFQLINMMADKVPSAIGAWKKQNHSASHATH